MSRVIHISEMALLAIHSMVLMAATGNKMLNIKSVAQEIGASEAHLSKALQRLVKMGLLHSVRGPNGGFELAKPAKAITLLEVYQAIEGYTALTGCPTKRPRCSFNKCLFGGVLEKLNHDFETYLSGQTLQDYANSLK